MSSLSRNVLRSLLVLIAAGALALGTVLFSAPASGASRLPKVQLDAAGIGPRPIEDLTRQSVARDYAYAWQTMAQALAENRPDLLEGYFTGFEKQKLAEEIAKQKATGVRVRYTDLGHKLNAFFYAPAGDAMQLRDQAQLRIDVLDGGKIIHSEKVQMHYMVLMTPGADRWLVRDLESAPDSQR
jgi:hypothetical protein